MMLIWFALELVECVLGTKSDGRIDFDYEDGYGCRPPNKWTSYYPTCGGDRQSPIDLCENTTVICQPPIYFTNLLREPFQIELIHMLHTPLVKYHMINPVTISGGPMNENTTYEFDHYNIRWGIDSSGSEHTLDGKSFAAEMQLVFFDCSTGGFHEAVLLEDGIVILSVWLEEVHGLDNIYYDETLAMLDYITQPWSYTDLYHMIPLQYFLPEDRRYYYTYRGSLTYPPCPETVVWIIFQNTLTISTYQLVKLRRMIGVKGPIRTNRRPTQCKNCHEIAKVATPSQCEAPQ